MTPNDGTITTNPCTKMKFACRFLRSLSTMRKARSSSSICMRKRSDRIKMAAYWCMARAVGSRRAWSRAILIKLSRARQHHYLVSRMMIMRRRRGKRSVWLGKNKNKKKKTSSLYPSGPNPISADDVDDDGLIISQTNKLRELVPGGKFMDNCSLLEETAHFMTCLNTQVHIMQTIAHHYSK